MAFGTLVVSMLIFGLVAISIAHQVPSLRHVPSEQLGERVMVVLPAQLLAYLLMLALLWRLFSHHLHVGFFRALHWKWPRRWPRLLAFGALLAVAVSMIDMLMPSRPEAPIEKMMQTGSDAWLMAGFGVLIAPFVEEVLFRGLFFPALARRIGAPLSLVATALLFGAVHAQQLAGDWIEIAAIVFVGGVLTAVRWWMHSTASSTLVHMAYNATLFGALFAQTHGFTNLKVH
jgi:hypothetical protein